jgi:hypothetical protein
VGVGWEVENGALHLSNLEKQNWPKDESKDLLTNEEYDNFHFKTDWKISKKGNSGLIFYVSENKAKYTNTFETGLEMQVLDNDGHPDAKIIKHRAGDLYDLISSSAEVVKPAGEWNHAEIIAHHSRVDFYLNNQHVLTTTLWNKAWTELIAKSKFNAMPDFGTFKKGSIALQEHGDEVWYKNIKIKKL